MTTPRVAAVSPIPQDTTVPPSPPIPVAEARAYSVDKFLALHEYTETTSAWRVVWVLATTPFYGLVCALLPSLTPLQDPLAPRGVLANPGYLTNSFLLSFIIFVGTLSHWRASVSLPEQVYSSRQALAVSVIAGSLQMLFALTISLAWRFPIPMSWVVASSVTGLNFAVGHLVVFRSRCWLDERLLDACRTYLPALNIQATQIILYPAFSVLFDHISTLYQVLLTLSFPVMKRLLKAQLRKHTRHLHGFSNEVAVSGIEICASLYQSMILQSTPSQLATAIIMGVDVLQGLLTVKFFMDRHSHGGSRHLLVGEARTELLASRGPTGENTKPHPHPSDVSCSSIAPLVKAQMTTVSVKPERQVSHSETVTHALTLVNVAESILLVEYLEVAIPITNAIFIAVSCQVSSAQYNTRLRHLYFYPQELAQALGSIALYSLLQALSFLAMHLVMKYRYGLSATYHLAFILERHQLSIVGKMVAWLPIILHFTGIHYGVDFSFRFNFAAMLRDK